MSGSLKEPDILHFPIYLHPYLSPKVYKFAESGKPYSSLATSKLLSNQIERENEWRAKVKRKLTLLLIGIFIIEISTGYTAGADESIISEQSVTAANLSIVGIDEAIAIAAGNKVIIKDGYKILINGQTGAEIARFRIRTSLNQSGVTILNLVSGNCGTSYLYLQNLGGKKYQFSTGFDLTSGKASDFRWKLSIHSEWSYPSSGSYNFEWSDTGPLFRSTASWTSGWKVDKTTAHYGALHVGRVLGGTVFRSDGAICTSGYPTSSANVT